MRSCQLPATRSFQLPATSFQPLIVDAEIWRCEQRGNFSNVPRMMSELETGSWKLEANH
jgi:hypothetical protein